MKKAPGNRRPIVLAALALAVALVSSAPMFAQSDTVDGPVGAGHAVEHGDSAAGSPGDAHPEAQGHEGPVSSPEIITLPLEVGDGPDKEVLVLLDESHLKLALLVLRQGTVLPSHSAPVPTTIHVLEGGGVVHVGNDAVPVSAGSIVPLRAGVAHDVVPEPGTDMLLLVHYLRSGEPTTEATSSKH